jgi:hypothetical protein
MRPLGSRRGNALLRASVEQSARRRLESWIVPHVHSAPSRQDEARERTCTRAFYDRLREHVFPRMAPALRVDGAEVRYLGTNAVGLWGLRAPQGLVLAYECAEAPALLAERVRRWVACLRTRTAPGMLLRRWGRPVYGARHDAASDAFDVVWATPGDWCGVVLADEPGPVRRSLPPHWSPPERARA